MSNKNLTKFWVWFLVGSGGKPGFRRLVNRWLFFHIPVGLLLALVVRIDVQSAANAVLLPLAGILIGLSFAWAGNAQALMQTTEIEDLSERRPGGFVEYVYTYQTAILCILLTLVLWGFAGLKIFDDVWPTPSRVKSYLVIKSILFSFASLTLRECWHVVLSAQLMLIVRREIAARRGKEIEITKVDLQTRKEHGETGPPIPKSE